jgi:diguanylate cyclase (GGDEF)-like protein
MSDSGRTRYWIGCVDDDRSFLESASRLIARAVDRQRVDVPCEVELANSAEEFAEVAAEMEEEGATLALLVTDQIMPGCTGIELIERVKPAHPETSCVLLTGYAGLESARYAINRHLLDQYVCKPIEDMDGFARIIHGELERFHLRRMETQHATEIVRKAEELRQANAGLQRMKEAAEAVAYFSRELRTLDLAEVLDLVPKRLVGLFGAEACYLFVPDPGNTVTLSRERRRNCLAAVPPNAEVNEVIAEVLKTGRPSIRVCRGACSGAIESRGDGQGCVVMPLRLSRRELGVSEATAMPALLCLCGIAGRENLSHEEIEYKILLINEVLGANIANALVYSETERLASEDSLTHVKTRRVLEERIRNEWERHQRYRTQFCVALVDLDHLKEMNDTFGHAAGDAVLRAVADVLRRESRSCDEVSRYGGDEFCIVMPETRLDGARTLSERIAAAVAETRVPEINGRPGVSVGVASVEGKGSPEEILGSADRALYQAKRNGRGRAVAES